MADLENARRSDPHTVTVAVSGDVTMDWNLAREPLSQDAGRVADTRVSWQRGGAALLADLLETVASTLGPTTAPVRVQAVEAPATPIPPGDDSLNHSYAVWSRFHRDASDKGPANAWRVASFLGVDYARGDTAARAEWRQLEAALPDADIVVLDDGALGFRELSNRAAWRQAFATSPPWVVLKQSRPVAHGPLWDHLLAEAADRLVVILTIDDLRGREVQVSRALSWERTAQDLFWELVHKPTVNALSRVRHTVVSFGPAGAALVSGPSGVATSPTCTLFFDPRLVEGRWDTEHPGRLMGTTDCLTVGVVRELLLDPDAPRLDRGIQAGVAAERRLHLDGYDERGPGRMELGFPLSLVVEELAAGGEPLQQIEVPDPATSTQYWTIVEQRCTGDLSTEAAGIVTYGPERALTGVPLGRFGKLVTADRSEIEAFRSIGTLIADYADSTQTKPLSIGVFGPPGAGKSFGVKEVARSVAPGTVKTVLEFNLSQLRCVDDLADALHLVRDVALSGEIPLVFWDEFDTTLDGEPLGWLRYFLSPMQDGKFREGQVTHPVGRAVFVFAGGTCARVQDFTEQVKTEAARRSKGPDFVSRLQGYVNVLGPNRQGEDDRFSVIRRAILLRSILERSAPELFDDGELRIDPGVLRALLETTEYRHGARSLEAVVATSQLAGKSTYERSSLPAEPQLDLHVDARDFLALVQRPDLEGDLLERLARAAHDVYLEGTERDAAAHATPTRFDDLPAYKQEQNRRNVRDIPAKLASISCVMVPGRAGLPNFVLTEDEIESLAREEHDRWMRDLGPGWRHGVPTDAAQKVHEAYLSWSELPDEQKDKDRALVRAVPAILHRAGYAIVRTGPADASAPA